MEFSSFTYHCCWSLLLPESFGEELAILLIVSLEVGVSVEVGVGLDVRAFGVVFLGHGLHHFATLLLDDFLCLLFAQADCEFFALLQCVGVRGR